MPTHSSYSNVDGIYTGSPSDPTSTLIPEVAPGRDLSEYVVAAKSGFGRGGMGTKCGIARKVSDEGITVIIARGDRPNVLVDLLLTPETVPHTTFRPSPQPLSNIKRWIAHSASFAKGIIRVNRKAAEALLSDRAVSLLPIGITAIDGEWEDGDIVNILGPDNAPVGVGRASLSSADTLAAIGQRGHKPVVHYDYMYLIEI